MVNDYFLIVNFFRFSSMMRIVVLFFCVLFAAVSCKDTTIVEPENLIEEDKMVNIIYDLALLEGIKNFNTSNLQSVKSNDFVYKKYKIDSLQFAKSTQFYASDIDRYKKMYEEVGKRIEANKVHIDSLVGKKSKSLIVPQKTTQNTPVIE